MIKNEKIEEQIKTLIKSINKRREVNKDHKINSDLTAYIWAVEENAKKRSTLIFPNSSGTHAAIVLSNILKISKEVRIYDADLSGNIADKYEYFYESLHDFIKDDKKIFIIIDNHSQDVTDIYTLLKLLNQLSDENVVVKRSNERFRQVITNTYNGKLNFAVGDSCSFRLEKSPREISGENQDLQAFCSFNNPEVARPLKDIFDKYFSELESVF